MGKGLFVLCRGDCSFGTAWCFLYSWSRAAFNTRSSLEGCSHLHEHQMISDGGSCRLIEAVGMRS